MFKKMDSRLTLSKREEEILKFWEENKIFEKSMKKRKDAPLYSFYDGPPFATGTPHYGHILASTIKDVVPRYWTMRGYYVERKWGWDCHGLPIENIAEKELGITRKKEIEKMGVEKFNEFCRIKVLKYVDDWKVVIKRLGRWADMENSYKTMDLDFMESVWWVFKELWDKGFIYEGYRVMHVCTRCETTLSQTEVAEGYKDIKDLSATVKFKLKSEQKIGDFTTNEDTYILAWTTTPWTLPGNVALAVGEEIEYIYVEIPVGFDSKKFDMDLDIKPGGYIFSKESAQKDNTKDAKLHKMFWLATSRFVKSFEFKGKDLVGKKYEPLFFYIKTLILERRIVNSLFKKVRSGKSMDFLDGSDINKTENNIKEKFFKIYSANFVSQDEGTGIVHIAPAFGEDDLHLAEKENFEVMLQHVNIDGRFKSEIGPEVMDGNTAQEELEKWEEWKSTIRDEQETKKLSHFIGKEVKPKNNPQATDIEIIKYLAHNGLLFAKEKYEHSYPHCWRCDTPLINYATSSWFVNILKMKEQMLELAKEINWLPEHIKEGRFGKWLEGARDWSISRQRFWASVIPIWKCDKCGDMRVFGSIQDLEEVSGEKITDLHKHIVDKIIFKCAKCTCSTNSGQAGEMHRVPDVLDTWFDSGSMPYAQLHYPFDSKEKFEKSFPADFIAEGVDQTRCWFYYLHIIAGAIKNKIAFKNVIVTGIILAEDGKKMSKRLRNYPDPIVIFNKYGADALRFYFLSSPVMVAETLNFKESEVAELARGMFRMLWNSYLFFQTYASKGKNPFQPPFAKGGVKLSPPLQRGPGGFIAISQNLLDKWILSELNILTKQINDGMEKYELVKTVRAFPKFIDNFSNWYIRRSRDRFAKLENDPDRINAEETMYNVLMTLAKLLAPFTPFVTEEIYKNLTGEESVHFADYPKADKNLIDKKLNKEMKLVREVVTLGLAARAKVKIKVRQPLQKLKVKSEKLKVGDELQELIKDELNIKEILFIDELKEENGWILETDGKITIALDTKITDELKEEGVVRDIARHIQTMRKDLGLTKEDLIEVCYEAKENVAKILADAKWEKYIKEKTITKNIADYKEGEKYGMEKDLEIEGMKVRFGIRKI